MMTFCLLCVDLLLITTAVSKQVLVDMSYKYNNLTTSPPDPEMWKFELINKHFGNWKGHGDVWFEINNFRMNEHSGTHVDAPAHFSKDGWHVSDIPLDRLYNIPAVVVDISERALLDSHAQLLPADLIAWESAYGKIPNRAAILVNSNWGLKWGTTDFMSIERDENGTITDMKFPSVSPTAAQWLVDHRPNIACVGIDTTSLEWEPGYNYSTHQILFQNGIYGIENAANVDKLPASGARVSVMPVKIERGSGAAARIVGIYDDDKLVNSSVSLVSSCLLLIIITSIGLLTNFM